MQIKKEEKYVKVVTLRFSTVRIYEPNKHLMRYLFLIASLLTTLSLASQGNVIPAEKIEFIELIVELVDSKTRMPVDGSEIYLFNPYSPELLETKPTEQGIATFYINPYTDYEVRACNSEYLKNGMTIFQGTKTDKLLCTTGADDYIFAESNRGANRTTIIKATLEMDPMTVGSVFELKNVYYDLAKATLRPESRRELNSLVSIMKQNNSITIELSSHTDCRGGDDYNQKLSERRAKSCYNYLISKGIDASRIRPVGYGEKKLLNECADGVNCPEDKHQINRRTEIEIITFEPLQCTPSIDLSF